MHVTITFTNDNPNTVYNRLAARLGREPTDQELREAVFRIFDEAREKAAAARRLPHQRRR